MVAVSEATGASLVHAFGGLTLAIGVIAALTAVALLERLAAWRQVLGALLVAFPYLAASYLIQGAFKETMEALFVLAFAIGLHQLAQPGADRGRAMRAGSSQALAAIPLAALAAGSAYSYSFAGLLWPLGAAGLWALGELALAARRDSPVAPLALARRAAPATAVAVAALAIAVAPEVGRMIEFASFETFDPAGPGLGNLFNPISPLEALGIWPSGDFRLDPGDGAMPAAGFYLGEALGLAALAYGLAWWLRRGERAVPAALRGGGDSVRLRPLRRHAVSGGQGDRDCLAARDADRRPGAAQPRAADRAWRAAGRDRQEARRAHRPPCSPPAPAAPWPGGGVPGRRRGLQRAGARKRAGRARDLLAGAHRATAGARPGSTLVLAPQHMLDDEHGRDYLVWELRGGRVCVDAAGTAPSSRLPPHGASQVITQGSAELPPFAGLRLARRAEPYVLWRSQPAPRGHGSCPLISVGERAEPGAKPGSD